MVNPGGVPDTEGGYTAKIVVESGYNARKHKSNKKDTEKVLLSSKSKG
jgi:hypothetical protein